MVFEKLYRGAVGAGIGGESINGRMMMYMVQYGATERSCRGLVEVLTLTPVYYAVRKFNFG